MYHQFKVLFLGLLTSTLIACNSGGGSTANPEPQEPVSPPQSFDIQHLADVVKGANLQGVLSDYTIDATLSNCQTIKNQSSCDVMINNYSASGSFMGNLALFDLPAGYTSNISSCLPTTTEKQTCHFTIYSDANANLATSTTIYIAINNGIFLGRSGELVSSIPFYLGGGIHNN